MNRTLCYGSGRAPAVVADPGDDLDEERAAPAVRAVAAILGWSVVRQ